MTPSTTKTEKLFRRIERAPARDAARSAYAKRLGAWKAQWGFVDDRVLEERPSSGLPGAYPKGSRDDSGVGYKHAKPVTEVPTAKPQKRVIDPTLAKSIAEFDEKRARLRAKFAIDRSSAIDHVTGESYTRTRRVELEELTRGDGGDKPYYLASEYGMRTAKDDKGELRSGLRIDHEQSAIYMRDNPGSTLNMFAQLFKSKFPDRDMKNVHFVNNPNVLDKVALFFGADAVPPEDQRRIDAIAPGIYALDCPAPAAAENYYEKKGYDAFRSLLQSLGTTPSSYQGFRALHEDEAEAPVSRKMNDNAAAMKQLKENPSVRGLKQLPDSHPMAHIAHTSAALLESLPGALLESVESNFDEETDANIIEARRLARAIAKDRGTFESLKQSGNDPHRRKTLQSAIATQGNRLGKLNGDLEPKLRARLEEMEDKVASLETPAEGSEAEKAIGEIESALESAREALDSGKPGEADLHLKKVPKRLNPLLRQKFEKYEKDPLIQSTIENIRKIAAGMDALVDDSARATRLFDVMMDEVYVLLARTRPYKKEDFNRILAGSLAKRAPSVKKLKNVKAKTFVVSSGMDAITTGMVAALKNHDQQKLTLSDKDAANANYFEVNEVLKHKGAITDVGDVVAATLNPSTPTNRKGGPEPDQVAEILKTIQKKLTEKKEAAGKGAPAPISLVLDATIETAADGSEAGTSELERLISALSGPIDAGQLNLVLCKSYQKYGSLGSAKLMAGSVTVLGTDAAFEKGGEFAEKSDEALDFRNNDESQLLAHLVSSGSGQELPMVRRASDNAKFVGAACIGNPDRQVFNKGLPFVMFTPTDEKNVKEAMFKLGVENRDSFGFQNSSCLDVPGQGLRINTGQDPENTLVEKFYALGHLLIDNQVKALKGSDVDTMVTAKRATAAATAAALLAGEPERKEAAEKDQAAKRVLDNRGDYRAALMGVDEPAKLKALDEVAPLLPYYNAADPRPKERVELDNINSIEASGHALASMVLTLSPEEESQLADRMKSFIDRGMKGVSPEMQGKMIAQWTRLAWKSKKADLVADTSAAAAKLPYNENKATLVIEGLPGAAVGRLSAPDRKALLDATMKGLDVRSKLNIAETLLDANDLYKVEQILESLKGPIRELDDFGKGDVGGQESLGGKLQGDVVPDAMTREERSEIGQLYADLRNRLKAARPTLEVWAPVEDSSVSERCAAYQKILAATDPDDKAQKSLLDGLTKSMKRVLAGLEPGANAAEIEEINRTIDVAHREAVFERKRADIAMAKRIPSVRKLIDETETIAGEEKKPALGEKLRKLAAILSESETAVKLFLQEHELNTKSKKDFDLAVEKLNEKDNAAASQVAAIAADDKDLTPYLKRLVDPHAAALQRELADGYRAKLPKTDQIGAVLTKINEASAFLRGPVESMRTAVKAPDIALVKKELAAFRIHKSYSKVKTLVEDELIPLLETLGGWTD